MNLSLIVNVLYAELYQGKKLRIGPVASLEPLGCERLCDVLDRKAWRIAASCNVIGRLLFGTPNNSKDDPMKVTWSRVLETSAWLGNASYLRSRATPEPLVRLHNLPCPPSAQPAANIAANQVAEGTGYFPRCEEGGGEASFGDPVSCEGHHPGVSKVLPKLRRKRRRAAPHVRDSRDYSTPLARR